MRLFVALDIEDAIRERMARFVDGVRNFAPEARWVKPESLHVTLKFIGEQPDEAVDGIKSALGRLARGETEIRFRGYGFFPTATSARVFWIGLEAGSQLGALAAAIDEALAPLGIAKEDRAFSPHLTLARGGGGSGVPGWRRGDSPNRGFARLAEKLAAMAAPEFGSMTAREFFLYSSRLSPKGSTYTKQERFPLQPL